MFGISREEELSETVRSFLVLYDKSHKGFKEGDAVKNAWDGVIKALEFIETDTYFYFNLFILFFVTILFIWLNPLELGLLLCFEKFPLKNN